MAVAVPGRAQEFERAVGSVTDISPPSSLWSDCLLSATEKIASLARSRPSVRDPPRSRPSVLEIQVEKLLGDRVPGALGKLAFDPGPGLFWITSNIFIF